MRPILLLALFCLPLLIMSCEEDVELNAPYSELPIVYGVLETFADTIRTFSNDEQPVGYYNIRIHKGFLTKNGQNALDVAKVQDSSAYKEGEIAAEIREITKSGDTGTRGGIKLYRTLITNKNTNGDFYAPNEYVYRNRDSVRLDPKKLYTVRVRNVKSGKVFYAETDLVGRIKASFIPRDLILKPKEGSSVFRMSLTGVDMFYANFNKLYENNGKFSYKANLRIFYQEKVVNGNTADSSIKSFLWENAAQENNIADPTATQELSLNGNTFFALLASKISPAPNANTTRKFKEVWAELYIANYTFARYIDVNNNYFITTNSRPIYTNVVGGLGFVGSRAKKIEKKLTISSTVVDAMNSGESPNTRALNFIK